MKCPFRLDSHQIQGGANTADYANIFPIVQWLVKKVIETREETGDLMRQFSESQFGKNFVLPSEGEMIEHQEEASRFLSSVTDRYKINRKFRSKESRRVKYLNGRSREESVQMALLEFGDYYKMNKPLVPQKQSSIAKDLEQQMGGKKKEGGTAEEEEERKRDNMKKDLMSFSSSGRVNFDVLGGLLPDNIEEV